jgi:hypothetical protein
LDVANLSDRVLAGIERLSMRTERATTEVIARAL